MKKLLLAGLAALLAASSPALAANRLKAPEILGHWCGSGDPDKDGYVAHDVLQNVYYRAENLKERIEKCGDGIMKFRPDRYEGWEHGCSYLSVREWDDRSKPYATKTNRGAPTAEIVAACAGEGCTWREHLVVYWSKGTLWVRARQSGERC
jgi:hypothetical protein